jgi:hypothetical protein
MYVCLSHREVIPVHEVSSKDGSNIEELVNSIGGVIARTSSGRTSSRGASPSPREVLKAAAAPPMVQQQQHQQAPPAVSAPAPAAIISRQSSGSLAEKAATASALSATADVTRLERQQDELQLAVEEQQGAVAEAAAAAVEAAGRVGELEAAFGKMQQSFEEVLRKLMAQQSENTDALTALRQTAAAQEQRTVAEAAAREKVGQDSEARGRREEQALSTLSGELSELTAAVSRVSEEVQSVTERNRQSEGRLQALEEDAQNSNSRADTPPPVGGDGATQSSSDAHVENTAATEAQREADRAAVIAAVERRVETQLAESQRLHKSALQTAEGRLKDELAGLIREGLGGYESRLGGVEEELAECALESAGHAEEAREVAKSSATASVAKAVEQAAQLLNEEVRRLEAEWESRLADLATDVETAAMLGGAGSQGEAEAEERANRLSEELRATKASLAVTKTELELQQGEIAMLTSRADSAEEDNAELRARMDKLQSMMLAMGDSPFASPIPVQGGGGAGGGGPGRPVASPARGGGAIGGAGGSRAGGSMGNADVSLRFDQSAVYRTTTDEIEADLMGNVNFNASMGGMSPMASPHVADDLDSSAFVLDSTGTGVSGMAAAAAQQQQLRVEEERPWPSQRRASRDAGVQLEAAAAAADGAQGGGDGGGSSPPRRPRTAPPGWHEELERMLTEEKDESTAAMEAFTQNSQRRLSFRAGKRRQVTPSDGTLRGYIRHCYDGCDDDPVRYACSNAAAAASPAARQRTAPHHSCAPEPTRLTTCITRAR